MRTVEFVAASMAILASAAVAADQSAQTPTTELPRMTVADTADSEYVVPNATSATKTDTPIMETPRSVYVVPQEVLQDQQALTLDKVLTNVPGVNSGGGAGIQESITLRGFFTTTTFVNGFRLEEYSTTGGGTVGATTLTNVDHVEVLLGPAAILYGRVEPGGMVNIVTKQPGDQLSVSAQQILGSWNHSVTSIDLNAPLNGDKTVLFRVNASYDTSDSWRDGVYSRVSFLDPVLRWNIDPSTTLTVEGELRRSVSDFDVQAVPLDPTTNALVMIPRNPPFLQDPQTMDTSRIFETLTHQFGQDWTITQRYMHALTVVPQTSDYYANDMYEQNGAWFVDRNLNVSSSVNKNDAAIVDLVGHFNTGPLHHTLLVGSDFYRTEVDFTEGGTAALSTTPVVNPTPASLTADPAYSGYFPQVSNDYGIYVQDQVKLGSSVQLVLGERYQHFDTASGVEAPLGTPVVPSSSTRDKAFTPHVGVLWQSRDWLSVYASYATNFGMNNGFDYQGKPLDPESGKQYEFGAKSELLGGRVMMSAAWFDLTKTNLAVGDPLHPNFQITIGQVRSRGAEWDVQGEIAPGWNLIANVSYDPTLITVGGPPGSGYVQGDPLAGDPNWMANLWTTYKLPQAYLAGWKVGVGANWRDASSWPGATNIGSALTTPAYWVCSAMASYERLMGSAKVSFQLNIENLFNHFYYYDLYPVASSNYVDLNYSTPRSVTAALKVAF